jgi:uncharacterized membrane protein
MRLIRLLKNDLREEIQGWVEKNIISLSQAEAISQQYGMDYHTRSQHSFGYHVLVVLGYLFIGLSIITLIGANWDEIPRALRMGVLIATTLTMHLAGLLYLRSDQPAVATGWFFLGCLMYGASIMLIAQIYHIGEHFPDGIFWWAIGTLPLALLLGSNLLMALTMVLALTWFFVQSDLGYFPVFFPVFLLALAWQTLRVKPSNILFLVLVAGTGLFLEYLLAWSLGGSWFFDAGPENVFFAASLLLLFHGLARWLQYRPEHFLQDYGTVLAVWTLRFLIISLLVFSFDDLWKELITSRWYVPEFIVGVSIIMSGAALVLAYYATRSSQQLLPQIGLVVVYFMALIGVLTLTRENAIVLQVLDNLALVVTGIVLIVYGINQGISHFFYTGVVTIMITALLRYIDLVGDYIGAATLFAVFAAILLGAAKYWRSHLQNREPTA